MISQFKRLQPSFHNTSMNLYVNMADNGDMNLVAVRTLYCKANLSLLLKQLTSSTLSSLLLADFKSDARGSDGNQIFKGVPVIMCFLCK